MSSILNDGYHQTVISSQTRTGEGSGSQVKSIDFAYTSKNKAPVKRVGYGDAHDLYFLYEPKSRWNINFFKKPGMHPMALEKHKEDAKTKIMRKPKETTELTINPGVSVVSPHFEILLEQNVPQIKDAVMVPRRPGDDNKWIHCFIELRHDVEPSESLKNEISAVLNYRDPVGATIAKQTICQFQSKLPKTNDGIFDNVPDRKRLQTVANAHMDSKSKAPYSAWSMWDPVSV